MLREIVVIDEERCDGCGLCVPACHEGAIQVIDGKARVVSDVLCDGLGACLGHCPQDAIRIERREAPAFDESAVARQRQPATAQAVASHAPTCPGTAFAALGSPVAPPPSGCPSSRFQQFGATPATGARPASDENSQAAERGSELTHWPVQLRLLAPTAPVLRNAHLLIAADCVPVAYADFHAKMLRGRAVVIACPKLDDTSSYVDKLAQIILLNEPADITVAHMEVPCCMGILQMAIEARRQSGKNVPIIDIVVGRQGNILHRDEVPVHDMRKESSHD